VPKGATWLLGQVDRIGPRARAWAEATLAARGVQGVRVVMGLLSLSNRHAEAQIERACEVAQGHGAYHLRSIRQLIARGGSGRGQRHGGFWHTAGAVTRCHAQRPPLVVAALWIYRFVDTRSCRKRPDREARPWCHSPHPTQRLSRAAADPADALNHSAQSR